MKIGSLFSGVAGLDRAVEAVTGATPAWFVEFDAAPSKVLKRHYPGVPNYGDVTTVDWSTVEPVDIITAGYPCQPFSHAGKRKGIEDERHLWPYVEVAIGVLRPRLVVLENVAGHLTLGGSTVVGALTGLGYDARWGIVRASDTGAPHRRSRVFIVASTKSDGLDGYGGGNVGPRWGAEPSDGGALLPTPVVNDTGNGKTPDDWDGWTADMQGKHGNGNGHGKSLAIEAQRLLPTPRATDGTKGGPNQRGSSGDLMLPSAVQPTNLLPTPVARDYKDAKLQESNHRLGDTDSVPRAIFHTTDDFGQYAPAIQRWEQTIGEPAPPPTIQGRNGPRLNPDLPRWMMGFPPGWLDGLTPSQQLKAAGNAVCQQQAELALRILLGDS